MPIIALHVEKERESHPSPSRCSQIVCGVWVDLPALQAGPRLKSCSVRFIHALSYPNIFANLQLAFLPPHLPISRCFPNHFVLFPILGIGSEERG